MILAAWEWGEGGRGTSLSEANGNVPLDGWIGGD